MPPVPSVGGAVGTAARRPAPAGQLVIVIGELRGGVAALAAVSPRVVKCASSRADRLGKVGSLFMVCFRAENSRVYERRSITSTIIEHYCPVPLQCANGLEHM